MSLHAILTPGARIADRFVVQHVVAEGGMGRVYRARDELQGQSVALKLLPTTTAERQARAEAEIEILRRVSGPNVLRYVAHELLPDGSLLLATEWLEGEDLAQALERQPLSLADTLRVVSQVAAALEVVHSQGWLHGDIKPSNLFLEQGRCDRVVLLDFGIARPVDAPAAGSPATLDRLLGTVSYMAPELARGDTTAGPAADLFSLGCVFYACLTGQPPFQAASPSGVLTRILFEEPTVPSTTTATVPQSVLQLLMTLLAKVPSERPPSASELYQQLAGLMASVLGPASGDADSHRPPTLTAGERRLLTLIVARPRTGSHPGPTAEPAATPAPDTLHALFLSLGAQVEPLADGTVVVTPSQLASSEATDQAEQAVRGALLLMASWPTAQVVVVTGPSGIGRDSQLGEAVEQARQLLADPVVKESALVRGIGGILLDETTASLVDLVFDITPLSPSSFVIFAEQQRQDRTRLLLGKPTPCVGREHDLSVLETTLSHCLSEPVSRLVLVEAPPGYGKSRLRQEFVNRVMLRDQVPLMLFGRGDLIGVGSPFRMVASALRRHCGVLEREDLPSQRQRLACYIQRRVPAGDATRITAFLGELCGLSFPVDYCPLLSGAHLNPRTMNAQVTQAFVDFLAAELTGGPVLLILEDIQWGDALSVSLVQTALRELSQHPLLVLAFGRPEFEELFPSICEDRSSFLLRLGKLGRRACLRLVKHALGEHVDPQLSERLVQQADGSALYLEELIRASVTFQAGEKPATMLAMLQARLMRLPLGQRRLLRAASVFGQSFDVEALSELVGPQNTLATVDGWLGALIEAELIERAAEGEDGGRYRFRHALFQEAAYNLLTESDRALGHRLAAQYLQQQGGRDPKLLAEHYRRGGSLTEACRHYLAAAERALASSDLQGALDCAQLGMVCDEGSEMLGALCAVQLQAYFWRDQWDQALSCGETALSRLSVGSERWCRAAAVLLPTTSLLGHVETFAAIGRALPGCQPTASARPAYMQAASYLLISTCLIGDRASALGLLGLLRQQLQGGQAATEAVEMGLLTFGELVAARSFSSNPWENYRLAAEATRITTSSGDLRTLLFVKAYLGAALLELGDLQAAKPIFDDCLQLAERQHEPLLATHVRVQHERWLLASTQPDSVALALASAVRTIENPATNPLLLGESLANQAACQLAQGTLAEAESSARKACLALAGVPSEYLWALSVLLHALRAQQKYAETQSLIAAGRAALASCGGAYSETTFLAAAAELLLAAEGAEAARALMQEASDALQRSVEHIPSPAQRTSYLERVPAHARLQSLARL